jgi:hypothetical protein
MRRAFLLLGVNERIEYGGRCLLPVADSGDICFEEPTWHQPAAPSGFDPT